MSKLDKITINFDINTDKVIKNLADNNFTSIRRNKGHDDLHTYLTNNGFTHSEQESSYISEKPMRLKQVQAIIEGISSEKKLSYLPGCFSSVTITRVNEKIYDITKLIASNETISILEPKRALELKNEYNVDLDLQQLSGKQIRFDFDTNKLKDIGAETNAYKDAENFFTLKNYNKTQRSVYTLDKKVSDAQIIKDVMNFFSEHPDYKDTLKSIQVSSVGKIRDITKIANNEAVEIGKVKTVSKNKDCSEDLEL